jgi:hypothetical protein
MTVKELIEVLSKLDPRSTIVVDGYEDGYAEDVKVLPVFLLRNGHGETDGIYGRHSNPNVGPQRWRQDATDPKSNHDMNAVLIGEGRFLMQDWEKER